MWDKLGVRSVLWTQG